MDISRRTIETSPDSLPLFGAYSRRRLHETLSEQVMQALIATPSPHCRRNVDFSGENDIRRLPSINPSQAINFTPICRTSHLPRSTRIR
jgi:hypothetical protein